MRHSERTRLACRCCLVGIRLAVGVLVPGLVVVLLVGVLVGVLVQGLVVVLRLTVIT